MAACPSNVTVRLTPRRAATPSKKRPRLEVGGVLMPLVDHPLQEPDVRAVGDQPEPFRRVPPGGAVGVSQETDSDTPGFADGLFSAGQGKFLQVTHPGEGSLVGNEKFASPDMSVRPVTRAVHGQADDFAVQAVFGHAAHDMGMMMLNVKSR